LCFAPVLNFLLFRTKRLLYASLWNLFHIWACMYSSYTGTHFQGSSLIQCHSLRLPSWLSALFDTVRQCSRFNHRIVFALFLFTYHLSNTLFLFLYFLFFWELHDDSIFLAICIDFYSSPSIKNHRKYKRSIIKLPIVGRLVSHQTEVTTNHWHSCRCIRSFSLVTFLLLSLIFFSYISYKSFLFH
jgi:hypothetical protein